MTKRAFTLFEVLISVSLLSFVAVATLQSLSNYNKSIKLNKIRDTIFFDSSFTLLKDKQNIKDEIKLSDIVKSFSLDDNVRRYIKDRKISFDEVEVEFIDELQLSLVKIVTSNDSMSSSIYSYKIRQ